MHELVNVEGTGREDVGAVGASAASTSRRPPTIAIEVLRRGHIGVVQLGRVDLEDVRQVRQPRLELREEGRELLIAQLWRIRVVRDARRVVAQRRPRRITCDESQRDCGQCGARAGVHGQFNSGSKTWHSRAVHG